LTILPHVHQDRIHPAIQWERLTGAFRRLPWRGEKACQTSPPLQRATAFCWLAMEGFGEADAAAQSWWSMVGQACAIWTRESGRELPRELGHRRPDHRGREKPSLRWELESSSRAWAIGRPYGRIGGATHRERPFRRFGQERKPGLIPPISNWPTQSGLDAVLNELLQQPRSTPVISSRLSGTPSQRSKRPPRASFLIRPKGGVPAVGRGSAITRQARVSLEAQGPSGPQETTPARDGKLSPRQFLGTIPGTSKKAVLACIQWNGEPPRDRWAPEVI